jgi:hypothetical protein
MTDTIVLHNAFLIDSNGGDSLPPAGLVVEDGTIREEISEGGLTKIPASRIIDKRQDAHAGVN